MGVVRRRSSARSAVEDRDGAVPVAVALAPFDRRVVVVGAVVFTVLMTLSPLYGFHRDELYFLDAARHLQLSYVDQPILAPLLARASLALFGVSLPGLRLWPALAAFATVIVGALTARELGGGRQSQLVAAVAVATMPAMLAVDHLEGPTSFDVLAWAALSFVIVRVGRSGEQRWWLVGGVILGVGLANKHSVGLFAAAVFLGALCVGGRRDVLNRWFALGALIAATFTVPDLIWQAQHGWATIAMTRSLNAENGGLANVGNWTVGQLIMTSVAFLGMWLAGIKFLWRSRRALWRALVLAYGVLFLLFAFTTGSKIYYLLGAYVYLLAAGAVAFEKRWAQRARGPRRLLAFAAVTTLAALPLVLPVLPASDVGWTYAVNQSLGESIGWPELVHTVAHAWRSLPAATRTRAVIFTADYGEAGAINELGRGLGMPTAVSGQNSEWWWGPGNPLATTVLAVAPGPRDVTGYRTYLERFFAHVTVVATFRNPAGVHNQEWGGHVYLCRDPRHSWGRMWLALRHYD